MGPEKQALNAPLTRPKSANHATPDSIYRVTCVLEINAPVLVVQVQQAPTALPTMR